MRASRLVGSTGWLRDAQGSPATISVVIPARDEAPGIAAAVAHAAAACAPAEVIVVDGGSRDDTAARAAAAGARVLPGVPGRGPQVAAGAAATSGGGR